MKYNLFYLVVMMALISCGRKADQQTGLPYFNTPDFTPLWIDTGEIHNTHSIPPFSFTDQNGKTVSDATVRNKIYVVDFFFTRCGSICPKMTSNMNKVATAFARDNNVMMLSHSVTPELDNVNVLSTYARQRNINNPNWHLLTGNKEQIYNLARKGYFAEDTVGYYKGSTEFLHTENFILIDKHRHIRGVYNGTIDLEVENLIRHIKLLKHEG